MKNFIQLDLELLSNTGYTLTQKILIGYLQSFQKTKEVYCFKEQVKIAEQLGIPLRTLERDIQDLRDLKLIFMKKKREVDKTNRTYKNRKAIILVDDNNPYPILEESITTILRNPNPEVEAEPIQEEKIQPEAPKAKLILTGSLAKFQEQYNL